MLRSNSILNLVELQLMSRILFFFFLALFLVCKNMGKITSLEIEDDEIEPSCSSKHGVKILANVDGFGAVGDGVSDDTKTFANAWEQACSTSQAEFLVPPGHTYKVNATWYKGPCAEDLIIQFR